MAIGLGLLRIPARDFWVMTPRELEAALTGAGLIAAPSAAAPTRSDLASLMAAFPDRSVLHSGDDMRA